MKNIIEKLIVRNHIKKSPIKKLKDKSDGYIWEVGKNNIKKIGFIYQNTFNKRIYKVTYRDGARLMISDDKGRIQN